MSNGHESARTLPAATKSAAPVDVPVHRRQSPRVRPTTTEDFERASELDVFDMPRLNSSEADEDLQVATLLAHIVTNEVYARCMIYELKMLSVLLIGDVKPRT